MWLKLKFFHYTEFNSFANQGGICIRTAKKSFKCKKGGPGRGGKRGSGGKRGKGPGKADNTELKTLDMDTLHHDRLI